MQNELSTVELQQRGRKSSLTVQNLFPAYVNPNIKLHPDIPSVPALQIFYPLTSQRTRQPVFSVCKLHQIGHLSFSIRETTENQQLLCSPTREFSNFALITQRSCKILPNFSTRRRFHSGPADSYLLSSRIVVASPHCFFKLCT